jgi:hypothetical protein
MNTTERAECGRLAESINLLLPALEQFNRFAGPDLAGAAEDRGTEVLCTLRRNAKLVCASLGASNEPGHWFCGGCGAALVVSAQPNELRPTKMASSTVGSFRTGED